MYKFLVAFVLMSPIKGIYLVDSRRVRGVRWYHWFPLRDRISLRLLRQYRGGGGQAVPRESAPPGSSGGGTLPAG